MTDSTIVILGIMVVATCLGIVTGIWFADRRVKREPYHLLPGHHYHLSFATDPVSIEPQDGEYEDLPPVVYPVSDHPFVTHATRDEINHLNRMRSVDRRAHAAYEAGEPYDPRN